MNDFQTLEGITKHKLSTYLSLVAFIGYKYLMITYPEYKIIIDQALNAPDTLAIIGTIMGSLYKGK